MADYVPLFNPGNEVTYTASAAVTGGQVVANSGVNTVAPAAAASVKVVGVAAHDAANGAKLTVLQGPGMVHESTASGAITAGDLVQAGAAGTVAALGATPASGQMIGVALTTAADTALVQWKARV